MIPTKSPFLLLLFASGASTCLSSQGHAGSLETIYRFAAGSDGAYPQAGVTADPAGNLYGTTTSGGGSGDSGTVYRLLRPAMVGGRWAEQILHSFQGATEGGGPEAPVTLDGSGNIYSTALGGGVNGGGTVFKLDASANWAITVLYSFSDQAPNPTAPDTGLVFGPGGLLYGSTESGGSLKFNGGISYSLSLAGGSGALSIIFAYCTRGLCLDGPGGFAVNRAGQLFGVTELGGSFRSGVAYSLTQRAGGKWAFHDLHDFGGPGDVTLTRNPPLLGAKALSPGLYGCGPGGTHAQGAVYRLTPPSPPGSGQWTETILYQFGSQPNDPNSNESGQQCGLAQDPSSGKLYGTTSGGGTHNQGAVFELDPPAKQGDPWTEIVLYSFTGLADGDGPWGTPLFDHGRLYGVTAGGRPHAKAPYGTVWEYTP